jgi:hypothetical protein
MKGSPSSSHKKHKATRLQHTIGMPSFSARKKHWGAAGAISSTPVVVTQSQMLNYSNNSPPHCSPFTSSATCLVGSLLTDVNAINAIILVYTGLLGLRYPWLSLIHCCLVVIGKSMPKQFPGSRKETYDDADAWMNAIQTLFQSASECLGFWVFDQEMQQVTRKARMYNNTMIASAEYRIGQFLWAGGGYLAGEACTSMTYHLSNNRSAKLLSWAKDQSDFVSMRLMSDASL